MRDLLRNCDMTVTINGLHDNRSSQRVAAEQRQPYGYQYCNKFSEGAEHLRSLAKLATSVK